MRTLLAILSFTLLLSLTGCSSLNLFKRDSYITADQSNPAVRCICLWQEAQGYGVDDRPTRGFAGQIYFFQQGNPIPVGVDGDVRIFLFDDANTEDKAKPIHQFDFVAKAWNTHLYDSQFGPVYRVFIPYTKKGHKQVDAALRLRLTSPGVSPLFSKLTAVKLSGAQAETTETRIGTEFRDHQILERNGAVKITHRTEVPGQGDQLQEYLHNQSVTLGTQNGTQFVRADFEGPTYAERVAQVKQDSKERRIAELEQQLQTMMKQGLGEPGRQSRPPRAEPTRRNRQQVAPLRSQLDDSRSGNGGGGLPSAIEPYQGRMWGDSGRQQFFDETFNPQEYTEPQRLSLNEAVKPAQPPMGFQQALQELQRLKNAQVMHSRPNERSRSLNQ